MPRLDETLCQVWLNWPSGSGEEVENMKSLQTDRRTDGQTDDRQQAIRKTQVSKLPPPPKKKTPKNPEGI